MNPRSHGTDNVDDEPEGSSSRKSAMTYEEFEELADEADGTPG